METLSTSDKANQRNKEIAKSLEGTDGISDYALLCAQMGLHVTIKNADGSESKIPSEKDISLQDMLSRIY